jgi:hypothetical protein
MQLTTTTSPLSQKRTLTVLNNPIQPPEPLHLAAPLLSNSWSPSRPAKQRLLSKPSAFSHDLRNHPRHLPNFCKHRLNHKLMLLNYKPRPLASNTLNELLKKNVATKTF